MKNKTTKKMPMTKRRKVEYELQPTLNQLQDESKHLPFVDSPYFENLINLRAGDVQTFARLSDNIHRTLEYYAGGAGGGQPSRRFTAAYSRP